ncbi:hypothetical protein ACFL15_00525 [Patescibacteria group bacterium]
MPELEKNTEQEYVEGRKFIRIDEKIIYSDDQFKHHNHIAYEYGIDEQEYDYRGRPLVDDAGRFEILEGKLAFYGFTETTKIKGDIGEARKKTVEVAKNILGEDRVY